MQFELSDELIDEILFHMEDQNGNFFLDAEKGIVVGADDAGEFNEGGEDRCVPLPAWGPADGFRLMEKFAAELHNPVTRKELSAALDRGKGVFRAFKDALAQYPETEKRWFAFKDRAMKREIIRWYNALREQWGMELIGGEPDDIDGLALEDFRFRAGGAADKETAESLHRLCAADSGGGKKSAAISLWVFPGDICIVTENAGGEFAAYVSAAYTESGALHICALEVKPEYRGLGLGKALLARLLEQADSAAAPAVSIDLPAESEQFSRVLNRELFKPEAVRYCRKANP